MAGGFSDYVSKADKIFKFDFSGAEPPPNWRVNSSSGILGTGISAEEASGGSLFAKDFFRPLGGRKTAVAEAAAPPVGTPDLAGAVVGAMGGATNISRTPSNVRARAPKRLAAPAEPGVDVRLGQARDMTGLNPQTMTPQGVAAPMPGITMDDILHEADKRLSIGAWGALQHGGAKRREAAAGEHNALLDAAVSAGGVVLGNQTKASGDRLSADSSLMNQRVQTGGFDRRTKVDKELGILANEMDARQLAETVRHNRASEGLQSRALTVEDRLRIEAAKHPAKPELTYAQALTAAGGDIDAANNMIKDYTYQSQGFQRMPAVKGSKGFLGFGSSPDISAHYVPRGAQPTGKYSKGMPVYKLPNGQLFVGEM